MIDLIFPMNLHITSSTEQTEFFIVLSHRQSESSFDSITTYLLGNLRSLQVDLLCSLELYALFGWRIQPESASHNSIFLSREISQLFSQTVFSSHAKSASQPASQPAEQAYKLYIS